MIDKFVIVRCRDAGVHMGYLVECHGRAVRLRESRRLWRWVRGRFTLNEIAVQGAVEEARICEPVDEILLLEACEVIPCTPYAEKNLRRSRNGA